MQLSAGGLVSQGLSAREACPTHLARAIRAAQLRDGINRRSDMCRGPALAAVATAQVELAPPPSGTTLSHGLGTLGETAPAHMPFLLRIAHIRARQGGDSTEALQESARGLAAWRAALERGLLPDDMSLQQILDSGEEPFAQGHSVAELRWPCDPLHTMLLRALGKLGVARFCRKYPAVRAALLKSLLEAATKYHRLLAGETVEDVDAREVDSGGNRARTAAELAQEEATKRLARGGMAAVSSPALAAAAANLSAKKLAEAKAAERVAAQAALPPERRLAIEIVKEMYSVWSGPVAALGRAGAAFDGLEALLGGDGFSLGGTMWSRPGWAALDSLRKRLEDLRELRELVRSLGRGGGWGPLRRAPVQHLDFSGRPGLLRTVLEAQETRGLTRSGDISRLLPAEAALLARGRSVRAAKLLFFARLAEKGLQTYERDGWGEFPTRVVPERREVRPTADRGPILLCVDTSGSMRGPRETVAKALALECMRAAREQERNCYVFAFSGPAEVRELELNDDMRSVNNLLDFLEKVFNGGSDFNEPVKRCLNRLTDAKWANSDILLVSDGELRQPGPDIMRKLSGAKDKLGLRVHGLVVGSPEKKRADPAVLRSLCSAVLPNGKTEVLVTEFSGWESVQADASLAALDFDDAEGNARRRLAGLQHEKLRQAEARRRRQSSRASGGGLSSALKNDPMRRMPSDGTGKKVKGAEEFAVERKH
ncbi:hypothetical protein V8C86DRAFT_2448564 [Haematococcus lacustris]